MKIKKIKINSYGKLHDLEIDLGENINIIHGKNESGKSTILKFILNSFYGTSRNKKGKELSDFEKYKPWDYEDFSGKLEYKLDNNENYEIYREFNKKNPKIFNENSEDISKQFNINKNKGNEFFYEQTKIDEELFLSTSAILQQEVKIEKNKQTTLIQKIANMVGTGDDNVSFKRAIERLERKQLNEIGTERSREKPINVISRKMEKLENSIEELKQYENSQYEIEEEKKKIKIEIRNLENKNNCLKEIKILNNKQELEKEKINLQEKLKKENEEKINSIKNKKNELKIKNKKENEEKNKINEIKNKKIKNNLNKLNIFLIIIILINILQFILIKNKLINYIFLLTAPMYLIFYIFFKNKLKNNKKIIENNEINIENNKNNELIKLENELNILENNKNNLNEEIDKIKNENNLKYNLEKEKIKNNYSKIINEKELNEIINSEKINNLQENIQNQIANKKIKLHTIDIDKENIDLKIENKAKLEEELSILSEQYVNFKNLNSSINLAKEVLNSSYEKMKESVTPKFTQQLSETIAKITNGKYTNVKFNDELGLVTELENGNYVLANRLSVGTIDQLYLSLRLSIIKELSEETIPIFLDESFAYYDDERLKNILQFIFDEFKNMQIIIFTCTNREKNIFDELKINYNFIEL